MKLRNIFYINPKGETLFKDVALYAEIPLKDAEIIWNGTWYLVTRRVENFDDESVMLTLTEQQ